MRDRLYQFYKDLGLDHLDARKADYQMSLFHLRQACQYAKQASNELEYIQSEPQDETYPLLGIRSIRDPPHYS
jgi:hypothetical protein